MNIPSMNNNIQNKHDVSDEWCLQTIYSAKQAISIHNWNLETLVTEKFKVIKGLAMGIFSSILHSVKYARRRVIAQKMKFSIEDFFSKCEQIFFYIYINKSMDIYKRNRNLESSWIYDNIIVKLRRRLKRDCVSSTRF